MPPGSPTESVPVPTSEAGPARLFIFLAATLVLSYGSWWILVPLARSGGVRFGQPLYLTLYMLGGFGPTIAAYFAVARTPARGSVREFNGRVFRWRVAPLWYIVALGLPFALGLLSIAIAAWLDPNNLSRVAIRPWYWVFAYFAGMIVGGGLEELGWRGVMQPELERRMPRFAATTVVGVTWALWHLPLFYLVGTGQYRTSFPIFVVGTIGLAFVLAWLYASTGSVLLCVALHAAANAALVMGFKIPPGSPSAELASSLLTLVVGISLLLGATPLAPASKRPSG